MVQFAKYGPNAEKMYRNDYRDKDYRRRSLSRSRDRYDRDRPRTRDRDSRRRIRSRSCSCSRSPGYRRERGRGRYDDERHSRSRSYSASPVRCSPSPRRSLSLFKKTPPSREASPDAREHKERQPPLSGFLLVVDVMILVVPLHDLTHMHEGVLQ